MKFLRRALEALSLFFAGLAALFAVFDGTPAVVGGALLFALIPASLRFAIRGMSDKKQPAKIPKTALAALPEAERDASAALYEKAQQDYLAIDAARHGLKDAAMAQELAALQPISVRIMDYMGAHPEKIATARKFVTYYQDRTAALAKEFAELEQTGVGTPQVEATKEKIRQTLAAMDDAYTAEFGRLLSDKLLDVDAELKVMEQTLAADGIRDEGDAVAKNQDMVAENHRMVAENRMDAKNPADAGQDPPDSSHFVDGSQLPKPDEVFRPQPLTWAERLKRREQRGQGQGRGMKNGLGRKDIVRRPDAALAIIPAPLYADVRRQRILMSALAILLGTFGAHRFYQGRVGLGILYVLFCATGLPTVIGLVEGLRYATMPLEKFYETIYRPIG